MQIKTLARIAGIVALGGASIALYSFLHHESLASGEFCSIGETFNCDVVNKGPYSVIVGIPVSLIGIIGYLFMAMGAYLLSKKPTDKGVLLFVTLAAFGGLAFSLYLTSIEAFVLDTWCLLCLTSQTIMLLIAACVAGIWYTTKRRMAPSVEMNHDV